jgi:sarcosine oxidase subunit gamma
VADLIAKSAADIDPVTIGPLTMRAAPMAPIWAIAPYRGQTKAASQALEKAHGVAFPAPNAITQSGDVMLAWSGIDQAFLMGVPPDASLADHAAITDQSDAWAHLVLEGTTGADVLARLVPVDLRSAALPAGAAIRSSLGHMSALILRPADDRLHVLVFRSMARTAVHEIARAMRGVAARDRIQAT